MRNSGRKIVAIVAIAVVAGVVAASAAADNAVTSNWAGYAVTPTDTNAVYRAVSGSWVQPKVSCTAGSQSFSAFWIGLGGFSEESQALEQIGPSADCTASGKAVHSMWYELVPAAPVPIKLKVSPGNQIAATVVVDGTNVTVRIRNLTRKTVFTKRLTMASPDVTSAEWVAEAPSGCDQGGNCAVLPLANFGTVTFSQAGTATADGFGGTIVNPAWTTTGLQLASDGSAFGRMIRGTVTGSAIPGDPTPDGTGFSVTWQSATS